MKMISEKDKPMIYDQELKTQQVNINTLKIPR